VRTRLESVTIPRRRASVKRMARAAHRIHTEVTEKGYNAENKDGAKDLEDRCWPMASAWAGCVGGLRTQ
jgi:hypothetical protein